MQRFRWFEVSGEKTCLQCECLGEHSILKRSLKLLEGNDAAVRFECGACGFVAVGVVSVDGSEPEPPQRQAAKPTHNRPALPDPLSLEPDPKYVPPKTDSEALEMAYGEMLPSQELQAIIENGYPADVTAGSWRAERRITPMTLEMGEEAITEILVEFVHAGDVVFSRKHSSTEGVPDIEAEKKALRESCMAAIRGPGQGSVPVRVTRATGPVGIQPMGYAGIPLVDNNRQDTGDDKVRASLLGVLRAGG